MKEDIQEEARCRLSFPEEDNAAARKLINEMASLCEGHRPAVLLNVLSSFLVYVYVGSAREPNCDELLEKLSLNYRLQTKPEGYVT